MTESSTPKPDLHSRREDIMDDEISLIDLAITLAKYKKLILGAPLVTAVIVALITLFIPNSYTATTQIMPPQQQSGAASALLGQLGALSSLAGVSTGIKNPNDTYVAMLKSRTVSDNLIRRFKLQAVYDKKYASDTRKKLEKASIITAGKDGVIVVMVEDREPKRAAALANGYVEELQKLTQVLAVTEASQRRLFFETQLLNSKQTLGDAEIALKQLQEKTGLIKLDAQAEALVKAGSELKAQIALKEVELGALRTFATGNNPDYIRIEQLLGGLHSQLAKVEAGSVTTSKIPETGLEYLRKVRDLKYAETVYELLAKQFEIAKIDEAKEGSMIQVLDKAIAPEKKSKPKRALIIALAALAVGFGAVLWAFIVEGLSRAKEDAETVERLAKLRQLLQWK